MSLKYDLSKILPHDAPMIFIDELLDVNIDENTVKASVTITENKILYDRSIQGISSISGIEFMAQTVGCFAYFKNHQTERQAVHSRHAAAQIRMPDARGMGTPTFRPLPCRL